MRLELDNISFSYKERRTLNGVSMTFEPGSFTAVLGNNGSGKTTMLKIIAGLLKASSGKVLFDGAEIKSLSPVARASAVGYLPQTHKAVFPFSVEDVVVTGMASRIFLSPTSHDREQARAAIKTVGIEHLKDRPYTELSGGERQMALIARLVAQKPKIMLLDEPLTYLDFANKFAVVHLLRALCKEGMSVIASMHDPNMAVDYVDNVIFLKNGNIIHIKQRGTVLPTFSEIYGLYGIPELSQISKNP